MRSGLSFSIGVILGVGLLVGCGDEPGSTVGPAFTLGDDVTRPDIGGDAAAGVDAASDVGGEDTAPDLPAFVGSDDGEPCATDDECAGGVCLQDPAWPDGYCTARPCSVDEDCSAGDVICSSHEGESLCALTCRNDGNCRDGYWCDEAPGRDEGICIPGERPPPPPGVADGEPCEVNADCAGRSCLEDPEWPNGYCTTRACSDFEDCARGNADEFDNRCLIQQNNNLCVRICSSQEECRVDEGYVCQAIGGGQGICVPGEASAAAPELDFEDYPFEVVCGLASEDGRISIDYTIADDTTAYMITPLANDGARVQPESISLPDGGTVNFDRANAFQLTPSVLFGFVNPIVVPVTEEFSDQLQPGEHTLVVNTSSSDLCWYLLQETDAGSTIDLNVYLVGVPGVTADNVSANENFTQLFEAFDSIYSAAGVSIGELNYFDVAPEVAQAYQIVRSQNAAQELVTFTTRPEGGYDEALTLNVFFVRAFNFSGGGGAIGISMGLPGAAGVHGSQSSGVAFTTEFMGGDIPGEGNGNAYTGVVLAHEVGHYLGLFHTSEQFGAGFDPLPDTPECTRNFPGGCADIDNLMFPLAGSSHTELSEDQTWQILVNPLTKGASE